MKNFLHIAFILSALLIISCSRDNSLIEEVVPQQEVAYDNTLSVVEDESILPADAYEALQKIKAQMAQEKPDAIATEKLPCPPSSTPTLGVVMSDCDSHGNSQGEIRAGYPTHPFPPPVIQFSGYNLSGSNYFWYGLYDYAAGQYAYTKAGTGISGGHAVNFGGGQHNARVLVWKNGGWIRVANLWFTSF